MDNHRGQMLLAADAILLHRATARRGDDVMFPPHAMIMHRPAARIGPMQ